MQKPVAVFFAVVSLGASVVVASQQLGGFTEIPLSGQLVPPSLSMSACTPTGGACTLDRKCCPGFDCVVRQCRLLQVRWHLPSRLYAEALLVKAVMHIEFSDKFSKPIRS